MALGRRDRRGLHVAVPEDAAPPVPRLALALLRPHQRDGGDGLLGGTPHLHAAATETYLGVAGRGRLLVVDHDGPAVHALDPGCQVTCAPGTLSRVVDDGGLLVVVAVEHAAFAAAAPLGDAVVPGAASAPPAVGVGAGDGSVGAVAADEERHRVAVEVMRSLVADLEGQVVDSYVALHRSVASAVEERLGALRAALAAEVPDRAGHHLERLALDDVHHLLDAAAIGTGEAPDAGGPRATVTPTDDRTALSTPEAGAPLPCCAELIGTPPT